MCAYKCACGVCAYIIWWHEELDCMDHFHKLQLMQLRVAGHMSLLELASLTVTSGSRPTPVSHVRWPRCRTVILLVCRDFMRELAVSAWSKETGGR